jgi:hypothetical protein
MNWRRVFAEMKTSAFWRWYFIELVKLLVLVLLAGLILAALDVPDWPPVSAMLFGVGLYWFLRGLLGGRWWHS